MNMKKIVSLLLAVALLAALCACGGKDKGKALDLDALGKELAGSEAFSDTMTVNTGDIAARLYGFEASEVKSCVIYLGTGVTAEEIFLAEASDAEAAKALKADCETRIAYQKSVFESYLPEEVVKLDNAVLTVEGNYVILVVSADSAAAQQIVNGAIGG